MPTCFYGPSPHNAPDSVDPRCSVLRFSAKSLKQVPVCPVSATTKHLQPRTGLMQLPISIKRAILTCQSQAAETSPHFYLRKVQIHPQTQQQATGHALATVLVLILIVTSTPSAPAPAAAPDHFWAYGF